MENPNIEEPNTKTQGTTSNPMDNQQETKEKILRVMTGALSVLSYPPMPLHIQNIRSFWILT
jgi:hypothetical protein